MLKRLALSALAAGLVYGSAGASDIGSDLQLQFNNMVNVTHPGAYQTASRGMLDGGSVYLRTPDMTIHPITFQPPTINAGCHGLDLRGGSISFISAQQFIDALRSIASAAPSYAFSQALAGMCPQCFQIIKDLQNDMQMANGWALNSCRAAEAIVDKGSNELFGTGLQNYVHQEIYGGGQADASNNGASSDYFSGILDSTQSVMNSVNNVFQFLNGQGARSTGSTGNSTYRLISQTQPTFDLGSFDPQFANYVMSMIGTYVVTPIAGQSTPTTTDVPPSIGLEQLVDGANNVVVFNCGAFADSQDTDPEHADANLSQDCLNADGTPITTTANIEGLYDRILPFLTSDTTSLFSPQDAVDMPGIVEIWAYGAGTPTTQQQQIVSALPGNMGGALQRLAKTNPGGAKVFAQDVARAMAIYAAYMYARQTMQDMLAADGVAMTPIAKQAGDKVRKALDRLEADHMAMLTQNSVTQVLGQEYNALYSLRDPTRIRPFATSGGAAQGASHN